MRKMLILAAALATVAAPAVAETLQEVVAHGIVLSVQGMDINVKYTPDGKFTALDGQITGTYKIDGDKLCTTSNFSPEESCVVYPKDKKAGDSFDLAGPDGAVKITINK